MTFASTYSIVSFIILIAYAVTIISAVYVVISENRNPVRSLAWVTVLMFCPVVGLILYLFFGRSLKNKALISRMMKRKLMHRKAVKQVDFTKLPLSGENLQLVKLAHSLMGSVYYPGNGVEIFSNGKELFEKFKKDLLLAEKSINMQFYIFEDDVLGNEISDILIAKAKNGVAVRVIYDHVGNFRVKKRFYRRMTEAGVEIYPFFRVTFPEFAARVNWRNHRKITVIDGKIGYIGGMNIADRYAGIGSKVWRDTHLRLTGLCIYGMSYSFALDWCFMGLPSYDEDCQKLTVKPDSFAGVQIVGSGPVGQWHNLALMFLKAIGNAKKLIYIQTPYFLPTQSLLNALQAAALAKVDVRIMIPRNPDSATLRYASGSYIGQCLRAGIKIYYYEPGMLHSKVVMVDDEFVTTGSTNFDFRSLEYNFECNAFIYSKEVNKQMRDLFVNDMKQSTRIMTTQWRHRPFFQKLKESLARLLSPVL